jgi:Pilin (bacterial filament)
MDDVGQPAISREELYTAAVGERAARSATLRTAVVKSYLSRRIWPENLQDLAQEGEVALFPQDAKNLRVDLGTITIRFTTLDGLRGGLVSFRPSFLSTGAVVWTCGYHTSAGVDAPNAAAGPDLTNIASKYLPIECKKHFWDRN